MALHTKRKRCRERGHHTCRRQIRLRHRPRRRRIHRRQLLLRDLGGRNSLHRTVLRQACLFAVGNIIDGVACCGSICRCCCYWCRSDVVFCGRASGRAAEGGDGLLDGGRHGACHAGESEAVAVVDYGAAFFCCGDHFEVAETRMLARRVHGAVHIYTILTIHS